MNLEGRNKKNVKAQVINPLVLKIYFVVVVVFVVEGKISLKNMYGAMLLLQHTITRYYMVITTTIKINELISQLYHR